MYSPGDILVPDDLLGGDLDSLADVLVTAGTLGLIPTDNLNSLDADLGFPPPPPADPEEVDTDGDELPDYWEEREKLDPHDDGSINADMGADGDPDDDGFTNLDEYLNGTGPNDFDSPPAPLTGPWSVAGLVIAFVALAAMVLTCRKRLA